MTKEITFKCNLCRGAAPVEAILGIYWLPMDKIEFRHPHDCHTHLCHKCFDELPKIRPGDYMQEETTSGERT